MKLSRTSGYSLAAIVRMASLPPGQITTGHSLAAELGIPQDFLLRLLVAQARGGILLSLKGPRGGYRLARPAGKITMLDVIEAAEGPIMARVDPVDDSPEGKQLDGLLREVCEEATEVYRKRLDGVTVAGLAGG